MESREKKKTVEKKVVILGNSAVGKTCLIRRYVEGEFSNHSPNTIGAAFFLKQWKGKNIGLWDTAGQEEFAGLSSFYCRHANAVILCYDICNRISYDILLERHSKLLESVGKNCVMVFVGTKNDLINKKLQGTLMKRKVTAEEATEKALEYSKRWDSLPHPQGVLPVFETSSKTGYNVTDVFEYIFESLVPVQSSLPRLSSVSGTINVTLDQPNMESRQKKCCKS